MQTCAGIKAFKCKICEYKTGKKSDLKKHIEAVHEGIKKFKCNICDYKAARNANLKKHIESVHEGIKPFKRKKLKKFNCSICDYKTAQKHNLKKHVESVHEGIKAFKCNICDYECARNSYLKIHIERHITLIHEKKKNENNMSKSAGQRKDQEVSFQCIKLEPSTLKQSQTLDTADPLLIHEFKEENFEENEATPIQDLAPVYIKQEEFGASGFQNEQENEMIDIKEELLLRE